MSTRPDRLTFFRDIDGQWRWHYRSSNGKVLADSGQGYSRRIDAVRGASRVTGANVVEGLTRYGSPVLVEGLEP